MVLHNAHNEKKLQTGNNNMKTVKAIKKKEYL